MMTHLKHLLVVFAFLSLPLWAQTDVGGASLNGLVTDPSGAVVAGAKVTAQSPDTGLTRDTESTTAGFYLLRLPVGTYDISVESKGFKKSETKGLTLGVGATVAVNFSLQVGVATESVDVTGEMPVVETTRTTVSTRVDSIAVADLPVNGRNFIDFTTLTPGVVKDPTRGGDLAFGGQRGPANSLLVDGADSNNLFYGQATGRTGFRPYAFSQDAVQEFQVNANSFPAEIGRASGGAINVVTKSGTNAFHGSAFEFYRDKGMNANTFTNNRIGAKKSPYHFNQFGGSFGGPVRKDKIFFFINYDQQKNASSQVMAPNTLPTPAQLPVFQKYLATYQLGIENKVALAKVDINIDAKSRLSLRYNLSRYTGVNAENSGPSSAAEHTGNNEVNTDTVAAVYTRTIGASAVWESHLNWVKDSEPGSANATLPEVVILNAITFGRNNFSPRYTNTSAIQPISNVTLVKGRHSLKFGFDFNFARADNYFPGNFGGSYTFNTYQDYINNTPSKYVQGFSGSGGDVPISHPDVNEWAVFAQDSWRATSRVTLDYGLRYDFFQYRQPTTKNNNAALLAQGYDTSRIPTQNTNFAPRIGVAARLTNDDRVVLRGGYGVYYGRTSGLLLSTAILQNGIDVLTYTLTSGLPTYPNTLTVAPGPAAPPDIYVADPNFKTAYTHQASVQVEGRLDRRSSVTVGYLGVFGRNLTRTRDVNLAPATPVVGYICPTSAACTSADGSPVTYLRHNGSTAGIIRPNTAFGRISIFDSNAVSDYNAGFVQYTRRFSEVLQLQTSYTYSKVIDTRPDNTSVVSGNAGDDAKIAQDTLNPDLDRAVGDSDLRHKFVFSGVWSINYVKSGNAVVKALANHWELSMISQEQSGRPFNALVTGDPNADGNNANDRSPAVGRNTIRGTWFETVDIRLTRDIPLFHERVRLRLIAEAFNSTNRANINALVATQYTFAGGFFRPTTNYLTTSTVYDPRILQLAAKIVF